MNDPRKGEDEESKKEEDKVMIMFLKDIKSELSEMRKDMKEMNDRVDARVYRMEERLDKLESRIEEIEKKKEYNEKVAEESRKMMDMWKDCEISRGTLELKAAEETKKEVKKLKKILEDKERKERKNNIVIKGLKNVWKDPREVAKEFLGNEFRVNKNIKNIRKAGKEGKEVLIIEFEEWQEKEIIMKEKSKLKGRDIYIDHDLTKEERDIQRKLRERAKREREEGKKVKIGYKKIIIEGKTYIWNEEAEDIEASKYESGRRAGNYEYEYVTGSSNMNNNLRNFA